MARSADKDFDIVSKEIDEQNEFLNAISQSIWKNPELNYNEYKAHTTLTDALQNFGFEVQREYIVPTAFKGEFRSKPSDTSGPNIAVLLEYDALPEIGHACGHNLIAEAGLATALAVKAAMIHDPDIPGKLVVLGCPAEEGGGGKMKLIQGGAFKEIDAAIMVHPSMYPAIHPPVACAGFVNVDFKGKEAHAATHPQEGRNALDAAVLCYQSLGLLRQQLKPSNKINVIISNGGKAANIIPSLTRMDLILRENKRAELKMLTSKVEACIKGAAMSTACEADIQSDPSKIYEDLLPNEVIGKIFESFTDRLGLDFKINPKQGTASTDMGNVSYVVPSLQPCYSIPTKGVNHTIEFREAAGSDDAQEPTLQVAKAMALTMLRLFRSPSVLAEAKKEFEKRLEDEKNNG